MNKQLEKLAQKGQEFVMKTTRPVRTAVRFLDRLLLPTRWSLGKRGHSARGEKFSGFYKK